MKLFLFFAAAALIVGGIYHTEVSQYVADLSEGSSYSGGGTSVVDSVRNMGSASSNLLGGVNNALDR